MTNVYDDDYDDQNSEGDQGAEQKKVTLSRRQLNALEKGKREAEEKANRLERRVAFIEAGIDMADPKTKYFVNGYDGEVKAEDIKKAAIEAGFLADPDAKTEETGGQQQLTPEQQAEAQQQAEDAQLFQGIYQATQQQDTSGVNHTAGMAEAIQKNGIDGMVSYMRNHGIPVAGDHD